jgi:hypothetical protein
MSSVGKRRESSKKRAIENTHEARLWRSDRGFSSPFRSLIHMQAVHSRYSYLRCILSCRPNSIVSSSASSSPPLLLPELVKERLYVLCAEDRCGWKGMEMGGESGGEVLEALDGVDGRLARERLEELGELGVCGPEGKEEEGRRWGGGEREQEKKGGGDESMGREKKEREPK